MECFEILTFSGSLRRASSNTELLQAVAALAPANISFTFYTGLGDLPHFNPDRENEIIPEVTDLQTRVRSADGILICSPEYARGVPGSLKNALDWLVGGIEIVHKPAAVINASPYSAHAHAALLVIWDTMSASLIPDACVTVPLRGKKLAHEEIVQDRLIADSLRSALAALIRAMQKSQT